MALTRVGMGTFTTTDADTERDLHATRAFDTLEELDAYSADVPRVAEGQGRRRGCRGVGDCAPVS